MIIDFHTHIFLPEIIKEKDIALIDPAFNLLYSNKKYKIIDAPLLISYIDEEGIDAAVAMSFPWSNKKLCIKHNQYMANIAEKYKGKIFPFGMVPQGKKSEIRQYVKEIKYSKLYGIGEIAFYNTGLNNESIKYLETVFDAAGEFNLPVCLHVNEPLGHKYTGKYEPSLGILYDVLKNFSELTIIFSHWGGGLIFYELMPEVSRLFQKFYYDTAASPFLYKNNIYSNAVNLVGSKRILFGSDYPLLGIKKYKTGMQEASLNKYDINKIMGQNSKSILGL